MKTQISPETSPASRRSFRPIVLLAAPAFLCWFTVIWFGTALSPLLFSGHPALQAGQPTRRRAVSLSRADEIMANARTLASAIGYLLDPEPAGAPLLEARAPEFAARPTGFPSNYPDFHPARSNSVDQPSAAG